MRILDEPAPCTGQSRCRGVLFELGMQRPGEASEGIKGFSILEQPCGSAPQTNPVMPGRSAKRVFAPGDPDILCALKSKMGWPVKPGQDETGYSGAWLPPPACFPALWPKYRSREVGGGRATRQPGQVRKEAALTRSGSGRSSVSYLFFERTAQGGGKVRTLRLISFLSASRPRETINCGSTDE